MRGDHLKSLSTAVAQTIRSSVKLNLSNYPTYIKNVREEVIYKKAGQLNNWYTKTIGLDEVKQFQQRVVDLQERLLDAQERRRNIGQELTNVRRKANELQDQIHKVKRQDDLEKFLDLMRTEAETLQIERDITNKFNVCDREEREIFTAFTNAVRDSHEKQRAQLEYTKYFGLILSVVGSFLTFSYSTLKKQDLKRFVEEHLLLAAGSSEKVVQQLQENQSQLNKFVTFVNSENEQIFKLIDKNHTEVLSMISSNNDRSETELVIKGDDDALEILENNPIVNIQVGTQKLILMGCVTLLGLAIVKNLF